MTQYSRPARWLGAAGVAALLVLATTPAHAQEALTRITYDISFPFSDTKTFVDQTPSWRGATFEMRRFITPNISIGGSAGWHTLDNETSELITIRDAQVDVVDGDPITLNGDISGTQFRFLNSFPLMFQTHYHLGDEDSTVRPYFGIGVGTIRAEERLEVGRFAFERTNWKFGITPEAGVLLPLTDNIRTTVGVRYHHGFKSGTSLGGEKTHTQYLSIQVGVGFYHNLF